MFRIDIKDLMEIASNESTYKSGIGMFRDGSVKRLKLLENAAVYFMDANVEIGKMNYRTVAYLQDDGKVKGYNCSCNLGIWKGACAHVVAALRALMEQDTNNIIKRRDNRIFSKLTDDFKGLLVSFVENEFMESASSDKYVLEPILNFNERYISLSFEVGAQGKRMYKVKGIRDFADSMRNDETVEYGKNLNLRHNIAFFDENSQKLVRFILKELNYVTALSKLTYEYSYGGGNSKTLLLYGDSLDVFMEMYMNNSIKAADNMPFNIFENNEDLYKVKLKNTGNGIAVMLDKLKNKIYEGGKFSYIVDNTDKRSILRITKEYADVMRSLLFAVQEGNDKEFVLDSDQTDSFMSFVYPVLDRHNMVDCEDDLSDILERYSPVKKLYFDMDGGVIHCSVVFSYGENEYSPFDIGGARNASEELRVIKALELADFEGDSENRVYVMNDEESIYDFYYGGIDKLKDIAEIYATGTFDKKFLPRDKKVSFGIRLKGDLLEVDISELDYDFMELYEIAGSLKLSKKYHRLRDGRFLSLDNNDLNGLAELVASLDLSKKEMSGEVLKLPKYRALYLEALTKENEEVQKNRDFRRLVQDFHEYKDVDYKLSDELEPVLRNYQKIGYKWLKTLSAYGFGGILADDMGLGKTIQVIAILKDARDNGNVYTENGNRLPSIVVSPTSLVYNWEKEINRFAPDLNVGVLAGAKARRKEVFDMWRLNETDVFITTYDLLKRDIDDYEDFQFNYIIADEAQYIKNPTTQNAQAIKLLNGGCRFALTGTPMENALSELWSIFDFIMPGYLQSATKFTKNYETPIVKNSDKDKAKELRRQISPFILRRIKKDVLKELPDKIETSIYAEMTPDQKKLYAASLLEAKGEFESFVSSGVYNKSQIQVLAMLTRLRQICCHPKLLRQDFTGGSGKLDMTLETIKIAIESGHRLLIFSQFTSMLALLTDEADQEGISYFYLDGSTEARERSRMTERFNNGERQAFFISLKAGGTGLNLTGADVVIHYDPWWNPAVMDQASDRAHRFGQQKNVQIYNMVAKDSIEEKILALHAKKRDLIDSVITEGGSVLNKMSVDEIRDLLSE